jgi:protein phosphatase
MPAGRLARFRLVFDDGEIVAVSGQGVIGRDPSSAAGVEHRLTLTDKTLKMSRLHLAFAVNDGGLWVRDCGSTNGSQIETGGERTAIAADVWVPAPPGATVYLAGRTFRVEVTTARAVFGDATLDWGVASHVGAARRQNQDSCAAQPPVFVVADGMGGHAAGDGASRAVVEAMLTLAGRADTTREALADCLADARSRIAQISVDGGRPPGSTVSGVIVTQAEGAPPCWMVINIGDSRTYRWDSGGLHQLTVDHSVAQDLIDAGAVTSSAARAVPGGNALTRAVVAVTDHQPDVWLVPMRPGDRMLVCSDGLTGRVDDATIARVLRVSHGAQAAADELVDTVVALGGRDDVTAVVVDAVAITPH